MKVVIRKSSRADKKLMAIFTLENNKTKIVHFGAAGYSDYTLHKDPNRKERYIARHSKHEDWSNPMTAGALSRWVLWNKPTLKASISDYKKMFGLK
jgi:hypothetical protein